MSYWILKDGKPEGPYRAVEILEKAGPDTIVSHDQQWVRFDRHPDFPPPPPQQTRHYYTWEDGAARGPFSREEVVARGYPDLTVSYAGKWVALNQHLDFPEYSMAPKKAKGKGVRLLLIGCIMAIAVVGCLITLGVVSTVFSRMTGSGGSVSSLSDCYQETLACSAEMSEIWNLARSQPESLWSDPKLRGRLHEAGKRLQRVSRRTLSMTQGRSGIPYDDAHNAALHFERHAESVIRFCETNAGLDVAELGRGMEYFHRWQAYEMNN